MVKVGVSIDARDRADQRNIAKSFEDFILSAAREEHFNLLLNMKHPTVLNHLSFVIHVVKMIGNI